MRVSQVIAGSTEDDVVRDMAHEILALEHQIKSESSFTIESFIFDDIESEEEEDQGEDDRDRDERRGLYDAL